MLPDAVYQIYGFLSPDEMQVLYDLAKAVPENGVIVEIGSFQGKSTVCLGLGAKAAGARVWAIDPHNDCQVNSETHYGMENHAALLRNLVQFEVAETVRVVALDSGCVIEGWSSSAPIGLLWIDGSHKYLDVHYDLISWEWLLAPDGRIAVHDSSGHFPDVNRALNEFLENNRDWIVVQIVDATTVLERSHV